MNKVQTFALLGIKNLEIVLIFITRCKKGDMFLETNPLT